MDYHVSTTVFEHIPNKNIVRILTEAKRILKNDREAVHFIDLSGHFQHQDERITRINFLRYSEREWEKISGNQFDYCNCLGLSDYLALCKESGFDVRYYETQEDYEAVQSLKDGFPVDELFSDCSVNGLCATQLRAALKARVKEGRYI